MKVEDTQNIRWCLDGSSEVTRIFGFLRKITAATEGISDDLPKYLNATKH